MKVMILREKTANTNFYLCRDGTLKIWETELTEFSFQLTEINCNYVPHKPKSTLGQINWVKGSLICLIFLSPPFHDGAQFKTAFISPEPWSSEPVTHAEMTGPRLCCENTQAVWKQSPLSPLSSLLHTDTYKFYLKERNRSKPLKQFELKDIFGHSEASFTAIISSCSSSFFHLTIVT